MVAVVSRLKAVEASTCAGKHPSHTTANSGIDKYNDATTAIDFVRLEGEGDVKESILYSENYTCCGTIDVVVVGGGGSGVGVSTIDLIRATTIQ